MLTNKIAKSVILCGVILLKADFISKKLLDYIPIIYLHYNILYIQHNIAESNLLNIDLDCFLMFDVCAMQ